MSCHFSCCRRVLLAALLCAIACPLLAAEAKKEEPIRPTDGVIRLFNGKNLDGLTTWIGDTKYEDPRKVFTVEDGMLHISGDGIGYIRTNKSYRDYHLVTEFKWGPRTWQNRKNCTKDSGVLVHCIGPDGGFGDAFMVSFEAQIIQGGVGDFIVVPGTRPDTKDLRVSLSAEVTKDRDGEDVWHKGGEKKVFPGGRINWYGRDPNWKDELGFRGKNDVESPDGQWTRIGRHLRRQPHHDQGQWHRRQRRLRRLALGRPNPPTDRTGRNLFPSLRTLAAGQSAERQIARASGWRALSGRAAHASTDSPASSARALPPISRIRRAPEGPAEFPLAAGARARSIPGSPGWSTRPPGSRGASDTQRWINSVSRA